MRGGYPPPNLLFDGTAFLEKEPIPSMVRNRRQNQYLSRGSSNKLSKIGLKVKGYERPAQAGGRGNRMLHWRRMLASSTASI
jgi:hypothetical protein